MTMTISDLHQFFGPYIRAKYQTKSSGDTQEALFVSLEGLRLWAASQALTLRAAMIYLLGQNIWPLEAMPGGKKPCGESNKGLRTMDSIFL